MDYLCSKTVSGELFYSLNRKSLTTLDGLKQEDDENPALQRLQTDMSDKKISDEQEILKQTKKDPILNSMGEELVSLLDNNQAYNEQLWEERIRRIQKMRKYKMASHIKTSESLLARKKQVEKQMDCLLLRVKGESATFQTNCQNAFKELDISLSDTCFQYYNTLKSQMKLLSMKTDRTGKLYEEQKDFSDISKKLSLFSLHLKHETRGTVNLKRLPPNHPQHGRCKRAACENLKTGFFSGNSGIAQFKGIRVLNVYKIENHALMQKFQQTASNVTAKEPGKVKGLFCSVARASVEWVICYGMHAQPGLQHRSSSFNDGEDAMVEDVFRTPWFSASSVMRSRAATPSGHNLSRRNSFSGDEFAKRQVKQSKPVSFPRHFSRYSTLEEDRDITWEKAESSKHSPKSSRSKRRDFIRESGNSDIRYLALCRVLIGRIFVASGDQEVSAADTHPANYDCIYYPLQEEYRLLNPDHVLPEFLIEFQYYGAQTSRNEEVSNGPGSPSKVTTSRKSEPQRPTFPLEALAPHGKTELLEGVDEASLLKNAQDDTNGGVIWKASEENLVIQREIAAKEIQKRFKTYWDTQEKSRKAERQQVMSFSHFFDGVMKADDGGQQREEILIR